MTEKVKKSGIFVCFSSMIPAALCTLAACLPPSPEDEPAPSCSMMARWTINGMVPGDALCRGLSPYTVNVEIWEDADLVDVGGSPACSEETTENFFIYRFDCAGGVCQNAENSGEKCLKDDDCCPGSGGCEGSGYCLMGAAKTKNFFFAGIPTCVKVVLVEQNPSAATPGEKSLAPEIPYSLWVPDHDSNCTLPSGEILPACTELEPVNFALVGFGPLAVDLSWEIVEPPTGEFGGCGASVSPVSHVGYALRNSEELIMDSIQIESRSLHCRDELRWKLVPEDLYSLEVWGTDENQTQQWHGTCDGLDVDGGQAGYLCEVPMSR